MIPSFPEFKKLELNDRLPIEVHTRLHKPYSDFNFTNLFAWDTLDIRKVSELNGNLVVLFTDYVTNEPVFSFLGNKKCSETARDIIAYARSEHISPTLQYVTAECALQLKKDGFKVEEDEENFDYIFSVAQIASPQGSAYKVKRQSANRFSRTHPDAQFIIKDLRESAVQEQILALFNQWKNHKLSDTKYDWELEGVALRRLLDSAHQHDLTLSCLYLNNKLLGFSIDEVLGDTYAISHFVKADVQYKGIYEYLNECTAKHLVQEGVALWNWEQDLNIEGLKRLKMSYRPIDFLKKYRVSAPSAQSIWQRVQEFPLLGFIR